MTTTTYHTDRAAVREFLSLPPESLPAAQYVYPDACGECEPPWSALRRWNRAGIFPEEPIRLHADRDGWRGGLTVAQGRVSL